MAGFLYLMKDCRTAVASPEEIAERGLLAVVERRCHVRVQGIGGTSLVAHGSMSPDRLRYAPDAQTWVPRGEGVEMGWWNDAPPGPNDLMRTGGLPCAWPTSLVGLGDGNDWEIPVVRGALGEERMPMVMAWQHGAWSAVVAPRFVRLRSLVSRAYIDLLLQIGVVDAPAGHERLDLPEQCEIAREALGLLYRVGEPEISALGLFRPELLGGVLAACIDAEAVVRTLAEMGGELMPAAGGDA